MNGPDADLRPSIWTGRKDLDLVDLVGRRVASLEAALRLDTVSIRYANRTLAVVDRDRFRAWRDDPRQPFETDEIVWSARGRTAFLTLADGNTFALDPNTSTEFLAVL